MSYFIYLIHALIFISASPILSRCTAINRKGTFFCFFICLVCEAIGTAATPGILCQPRVIAKMILEKQMDCRLAGETEVLGEILTQRHSCPSQNPTWPDPSLNSGRRGGKPVTNRLSYGAAQGHLYISTEEIYVHSRRFAGQWTRNSFLFGRVEIQIFDGSPCFFVCFFFLQPIQFIPLKHTSYYLYKLLYY
jgi:hypothetical protein